MSLTDTIRRAGPYTGDGVTTVFPYEFKLLDAGDMKVTKTTNGDPAVTTLLSLGVDYTLSGIGAPGGGSITLPSALPSGYKLTAIGDASFDQGLVLVNQGAYNAEDVMVALDRLTVLAQQLREALSRALVIPPEAGVFDFGEVVASLTALAPYAAQIGAIGAALDDILLLVDDLSAIAAAPQAAIDAIAAAAAALLSANAAAGSASSAQASLTALNAKITISTAAPSGGVEGDLWFRIL